MPKVVVLEDEGYVPVGGLKVKTVKLPSEWDFKIFSFKGGITIRDNTHWRPEQIEKFEDYNKIRFIGD